MSASFKEMIRINSGVQEVLTISEHFTPIAEAVHVIILSLLSEFPKIEFTLQGRDDKGIDFIIHDVSVYTSSAFLEFLNKISQPLSIEQYLKIGFLPYRRARGNMTIKTLLDKTTTCMALANNKVGESIVPTPSNQCGTFPFDYEGGPHYSMAA